VIDFFLYTKTFEKVSGYQIQVLNIAQSRVAKKFFSMSELEAFQFCQRLGNFIFYGFVLLSD